jgi:opacity protein-like surface antigen
LPNFLVERRWSVYLPLLKSKISSKNSEDEMKRLLILFPIALIVLTFGSTSFAQMMLGPKGVGAFAGYVKPEDVDGTIGFGALVDMGTLMPMLGVELEGLYWSKSEGEGAAEASLRDIAISAHGKYRFPMPASPVKPYVGGGPGLHFLKAEVEFLGEKVSDTDTKFGFDLLGGGEYEASPQIDVFAELRYSLVSDFNQFSIFGGAKFKLGM